MNIDINIKISLGDVPLLARALRLEARRLDGLRRRELRQAEILRRPGANGPSINRAAALERKADEFAANAERCEDLLKVLP